MHRARAVCGSWLRSSAFSKDSNTLQGFLAFPFAISRFCVCFTCEPRGCGWTSTLDTACEAWLSQSGLHEARSCPEDAWGTAEYAILVPQLQHLFGLCLCAWGVPPYTRHDP